VPSACTARTRHIGLNTGCSDFSSFYRAGGRVETSWELALVVASGVGGVAVFLVA
jgi:hypothetical protein